MGNGKIVNAGACRHASHNVPLRGIDFHNLATPSLAMTGEAIPSSPPDISLFNAPFFQVLMQDVEHTGYGQYEAYNIQSMTDVTPVPLPAAVWLLASGLGAATADASKNVAESSTDSMRST